MIDLRFKSVLGLMLVLILCWSNTSFGAESYPGAVVLKGNEIRWGQYKEICGIRGLEFPPLEKPRLSEVLKEWPFSGASTIVLRCQHPGNRFFSGDGGSIDSNDLDRLRSEIVSVNAFDLLPLVLVFDPSLNCQLDSEEAYIEAARTLIEGLGTGCWYLLCLSDQLDHPDWRIQEPSTDPIRNARKIASSIKARFPNQTIAAGSGSREKNELLFSEETSIDVLMGRTQNLEYGQGEIRSDRVPVIESILSHQVSTPELKKAIDQVGFHRIQDSFGYGFVLLLDGENSTLEKVTHYLETLHPLVDTSQKEISKALAPSADMNQVLDPKEVQEGFVSLFNGKDLSGWVPVTQPGNFTVKDGHIEIAEYCGGWLRSWEPYQDFIFRGEYWIEEGGNSGFFIRSPLIGRSSRIGFEFQVEGASKESPITKVVSGSIYDVKAPEGVFIRPNEWNEVEIQCVGPEVKITWNGELAHHFNYEEVEEMKPRALAGYIGLQDHYDKVMFRNLRIKKLN